MIIDDISLKRKIQIVSTSSSVEEEQSLTLNEREAGTFEDTGMANSLSYYDEIAELREKNQILIEEQNENYFEDSTYKLVSQLEQRDDVSQSLNSSLKNSVGLFQIKPLKPCGCDGSGNTVKGRKTHTT